MPKVDRWQVWDFDKNLRITIGTFALCKHVLKQQDKRKVAAKRIEIKPYSFKES